MTKPLSGDHDDGPVQTAAATWMQRLSASRPRLMVFYLVLTAAVLLPIFTVTVPPLVDYPAHLARLYLMAKLDELPALQPYFTYRLDLFPNLAVDLIGPALIALLPVYLAGRVLLALILVLLVAGTLFLYRVVHGRIDFWPSAAFLFLYSHVLSWGFLNFLLATAVFLFAFAGWIASARWPGWQRLVVFSLVSLGLLFCHLFAFAIYGLAVAAYELGQVLTAGAFSARALLRRWAFAVCQFVLPAVILLSSPLGMTETVTLYGDWADKLRVLLSPVLLHWHGFDLGLFAILLLLLLLAALKLGLTLVAPLRLPILALSLAAIAMPNWLMDVWGSDFRLPLVICLLLVVALRVKRPSPRLAAVVAALGLVLISLRVAFAVLIWQDHDRQVAEFRAALAPLPAGTTILTAMDSNRHQPRYWHLSALAVIDRAMFDPLLFTDPRAQPLSVRAEYAIIDSYAGIPISLADLDAGADPALAEQLRQFPQWPDENSYWAHWPQNFDYLVHLNFGTEANLAHHPLVPINRGSFFTLYEVRP
jgi:hypothetical protein